VRAYEPKEYSSRRNSSGFQSYRSARLEVLKHLPAG
jgi:hypothetical protein